MVPLGRLLDREARLLLRWLPGRLAALVGWLVGSARRRGRRGAEPGCAGQAPGHRRAHLSHTHRPPSGLYLSPPAGGSAAWMPATPTPTWRRRAPRLKTMPSRWCALLPFYFLPLSSPRYSPRPLRPAGRWRRRRPTRPLLCALLGVCRAPLRCPPPLPLPPPCRRPRRMRWWTPTGCGTSCRACTACATWVLGWVVVGAELGGCGCCWPVGGFVGAGHAGAGPVVLDSPSSPPPRRPPALHTCRAPAAAARPAPAAATATATAAAAAAAAWHSSARSQGRGPGRRACCSTATATGGTRRSRGTARRLRREPRWVLHGGWGSGCGKTRRQRARCRLCVSQRSPASPAAAHLSAAARGRGG